MIRILISTCIILGFGCQSNSQVASNNLKRNTMNSSENKSRVYNTGDTSKVNLSDAEWRDILSPEVYHIARQKGTERPWTSPFEFSKDIGTYHCKACGNPLFQSDTKFDSGCGWPSFFQPIHKGAMKYIPDNSHGMERTEVACGRCDAHLGHVFDDGPKPTGLRYCINGAILAFEGTASTRNQKEENKD